MIRSRNREAFEASERERRYAADMAKVRQQKAEALAAGRVEHKQEARKMRERLGLPVDDEDEQNEHAQVKEPPYLQPALDSTNAAPPPPFSSFRSPVACMTLTCAFLAIGGHCSLGTHGRTNATRRRGHPVAWRERGQLVAHSLATACYGSFCILNLIIGAHCMNK